MWIHTWLRDFLSDLSFTSSFSLLIINSHKKEQTSIHKTSAVVNDKLPQEVPNLQKGKRLRADGTDIKMPTM